MCVCVFLDRMFSLTFFFKEKLRQPTRMHLFAVFCLIFLVLAHCGHPGIQHISLQSLEKPAKLGGVSPLNVCSDRCISQNFISPQVQVQLQRSKWSKKQESEAGVYLIAQR